MQGETSPPRGGRPAKGRSPGPSLTSLAAGMAGSVLPAAEEEGRWALPPTGDGAAQPYTKSHDPGISVVLRLPFQEPGAPRSGGIRFPFRGGLQSRSRTNTSACVQCLPPLLPGRRGRSHISRDERTVLRSAEEGQRAGGRSQDPVCLEELGLQASRYSRAGDLSTVCR